MHDAPQTPPPNTPPLIVFDYREPPPSVNWGETDATTAKDIENRIYCAKKRLSASPATSAAAAEVLRVWEEAATATGTLGAAAFQPTAWRCLAEEITAIAPQMTISDITQLLRSLATVLHRCGRKVEPPPAMLHSLAKAACTEVKLGNVSSRELISYQAAVGDVLHVAALGGKVEANGTACTAWAQRIAAHMVPALAVGIGAVHAEYQEAVIEFQYTRDDSSKAAQTAIYLAQALAPMACAPVAVPHMKVLLAGKSNASPGLLGRLLRPIHTRGSQGAEAATFQRHKDFCADKLGPLLLKLHSRALAMAEWLESSLAPVALRDMSRRQLDAFAGALETAAGDDALCPAAPPARDALLRCASRCAEEAAWRVRQDEATLGPLRTLRVEHARRMAATAWRNLDAMPASPTAATVASAAAALEHFIAEKEDEEAAELKASIMAAVATAAHDAAPSTTATLL